MSIAKCEDIEDLADALRRQLNDQLDELEEAIAKGFEVRDAIGLFSDAAKHIFELRGLKISTLVGRRNYTNPRVFITDNVRKGVKEAHRVSERIEGLLEDYRNSFK